MCEKKLLEDGHDAAFKEMKIMKKSCRDKNVK